MLPACHPRRPAHEIRVEFKIMTSGFVSEKMPSRQQIDALWDEVNDIAVELIQTLAFRDYMSLLREMAYWYKSECGRFAEEK